MIRRTFFSLVMASFVALGAAENASAVGPGADCCGTACGVTQFCGLSGFAPTPGLYDGWHGAYYHTMWGMPVAQVVPPTAERQTHWGWGVGATHITPIWSQYGTGYAVPGGYGPAAIYPTPPWPSSTEQFGVYYVRGPW